VASGPQAACVLLLLLLLPAVWSGYVPSPGLDQAKEPHPLVSVSLTSDQPIFSPSDVVTFSFVAGGMEGVAGFECSPQDGSRGTWQGCRSPHTVSDLADGIHLFRVRGMDGRGAAITAPEEIEWVVDTVPPSVEITSGPGRRNFTASTEAVFEFEVTDSLPGESSGVSKVECWLDNARLAACQSPLSLTGLSPKAHAFQVIATDGAGNVGHSVRYRWQVDADPWPVLTGPSSGLCTGPFPISIAWTAAVPQFSSAGLQISGTAAAELGTWEADESLQNFRAIVGPQSSGELLLQVPARAVGDSSRASNTIRILCDLDAPVVTVRGPAEEQPGDEPFIVTFTWTEPVSGFSAESILVNEMQGKVVPAWTRETVAARFTATVHAAGMGAISIAVEPGAAKDSAGNLNLALSNTYRAHISGGQIVATDTDGNTVLHLPSGSHRTRSWSTSEHGLLAFTPDGNVLVSAANGTTLQMVTTHGEVLRTLAGFTAIGGIACSGSGQIFVSDMAEGHVALLSSSFEQTERLSLAGAGQPLRRPGALAVDGDGWLYVADSGRVAVYDGTARFVGSFKISPTGTGDGSPHGCASEIEVSGNRMVFVACSTTATVDVYEPAGGLEQLQHAAVNRSNVNSLFQLVDTIRSRGNTTALVSPTGLSTDHQGQLIIADAGARRLLVWNIDSGLRPHPSEAVQQHPLQAVAVLRDRKAPSCTLEGPQGEQQSAFTVTVTWTEKVSGFSASCIRLASAGGYVESIETNDGQVYAVEVVPAAVGAVVVSVRAGCVVDVGGNVNTRSSDDLKVVYFGGECSASLTCQWQLAEYEHQLAVSRMRLTAEIEAEKERAKIAVQEAAADARAQQQIEAEAEAQKRKLKAAQELAEVEARTVRERAAAEAEGRIREARENEDLRLRQLREEAEARKQMVLSAISAVASFIEAGANSFANDPKMMKSALSAFGIAVLLFFVAREGTRVFTTELARFLSKPPLVRETSRSMLFGWLVAVLGAVKRLLMRPPDHARMSKLFGDVVLEGKLHIEVEELAESVALSSSRGAPLRNVLLWGPPGTGKTMAARRMARGCGMGYAMMSGGDVVPLGKDAVTELHAIFNWAERSSQGVLLFIDEADAFLRRRKAGDGDTSTAEHTRAAINAVLSRTSSQSTKFMMVLASNRPEDLDPAILDRIDDTIHFPLPGLVEREGMIRLYFSKYIGRVPEQDEKLRSGVVVRAWTRAIPQRSPWIWRRPPEVELVNFNKATFRQAAELTQGFSGRELAKMLAYVQSAVYGGVSRKGSLMLSTSALLQLIQKKVAEHSDKLRFQEPKQE